MTSCKSLHHCKWGRSFHDLSRPHHQQIWCSPGRCTLWVLCDRQHHLNWSHFFSNRKGRTSCSDLQHCTDHWASWRHWGKGRRISWCDSLAQLGRQGLGRGSSRHRGIRRSVWHSLQDSRMGCHRPELNQQVSYRQSKTWTHLDTAQWSRLLGAQRTKVVSLRRLRVQHLAVWWN